MLRCQKMRVNHSINGGTVILVDEIIISDLVIETRFCCDLSDCRGACCQEGERGSPLKEGETEAIKLLLPTIIPKLPRENQSLLAERRFFLKDGSREELLCLPNGRCVFGQVKEVGGPVKCTIEELHGPQQKFQKPLFCHMFPLRLDNFYGRVCLNMEIREECKGAVGEGPLVVEFCKAALVRNFGKRTYHRLVEAIKAERIRRSLD